MLSKNSSMKKFVWSFSEISIKGRKGYNISGNFDRPIRSNSKFIMSNLTLPCSVQVGVNIPASDFSLPFFASSSS